MNSNQLLKKHFIPFLFIFFAVTFSFYRLPQFFFSQDDFGWLYFAKYRWPDFTSLLTVYHGSFTPVINILTKIFFVMFGLEAWLYHGALVFLHYVNSCLVFIYAYQLTQKKLTSIISALFFATTFSHWEAVMWLSGGGHHMVAAFFALLTLIFWFNWLANQKKTNYYAAFICFILAVFAKESAAPLIVLVFMQQFLLHPINKRESNILGTKNLTGHLIFIVIIFVYLLFRQFTVLPESVYPMVFGFKAIWVEFTYIYMLLAPDATNPFTAPHLIRISELLHATILIFQKILTATLPFIIILGMLKGSKLAKFLIIWVLITTGPPIFLDLPASSRYLYLPSVAFALLFGLFWEFLFEQFRQPWAKNFLFFILILIFSTNWFVLQLAAKQRVANSLARQKLISTVLSRIKPVSTESPIRLSNIPLKHTTGLAEAVIIYGKHRNVAYWTESDENLERMVKINIEQMIKGKINSSTDVSPVHKAEP